MFKDLIVERDVASADRLAKCEGGKERHLTEAAIMLAYGTHLLRTVPQLQLLELYPDGEHGKRFEIAPWLSAQGFKLNERRGSTAYGGVYVKDEQKIVISPTPGNGDVVATSHSGTIIAECKGGVVNSRHAGQLSRLRKGLCEAVGLLMTRSETETCRQVAVVPKTETTLKLAKKLAPRARKAGIEIALVDERGNVTEIAAK